MLFLLLAVFSMCSFSIKAAALPKVAVVVSAFPDGIKHCLRVKPSSLISYKSTIPLADAKLRRVFSGDCEELSYVLVEDEDSGLIIVWKDRGECFAYSLKQLQAFLSHSAGILSSGEKTFLSGLILAAQTRCPTKSE